MRVFEDIDGVLQLRSLMGQKWAVSTSSNQDLEDPSRRAR